MNPGSDPKRFLPQRRKLLEDENEMDKGELHFQYVAGEFLLRVTWGG